MAVTVAKEDVQAYENVRQSGLTNMFDVKTVCRLSGLSKEKVFIIMDKYSELVELHGIKRG